MFADPSAYQALRVARGTTAERFAALRRIADTAPIIIWRTDANDVCISLNKSVRSMLDSFVDVRLSDWLQFIHPDDLDKAVAVLLQARATQDDYQNEYRILRSDGSVRWMMGSGAPQYDDLGQFAGYSGAIIDVSSTYQAHERLAASELQYRLIADNSLDLICRCDTDGRYLYASPSYEKTLGYKPADLIGTYAAERIHPDDVPLLKAENERLRLNPTDDQVVQVRKLHRDGHYVWMGVKLKPIADPRSGQVIGSVSISRDISDERRARDEKDNADRQFRGMLEHLSDAFFALDNDWNILYANLKAAAFIGVDRDQAIGRPLLAVEPLLANTPAFAFYVEAMQQKQDIQFEIYYEPARAWAHTRIYAHEQGLSVFFQDITERHMAEIAVRESEQRFRGMIDITPAGYMETDGHGAIVLVNPAFCAMTGYEADELAGQHIGTLFSFCPAEGALDVQGGLCFVQGKDATLRHKSGAAVCALINLAIGRDVDGHAHSLSAFVTDISDRKEAERQLEVLATHDSLTGLPNRSFVNKHIQSLLSKPGSDKPCVVMLIDLDRFKEVNDSMGHASGDELLRQVGARLQRCVASTDIVARLGGDEFVVVAHCANKRPNAAAIAERLLASFGEPFVVYERELFVTGSIGISMFSDASSDETALFQNADLAMYRAKATGRNRYNFFEIEMSEDSKHRMNVEHALRRALERNEFEVYYQPRIDLKTMEVAGFEALLRWDNPELGRVPPSVFIPIAEDRGFISSIGIWVLQQACHDTKRLVEKFGRDMHVSVNLSAHQLQCTDLVESVSRAIEDAALPAYLLELEITESALIEDVDKSAAVLTQLKHNGVLLSVDDFGTGYSSLAYLKRFPVDILKLDRSFINQSHEGVNTLEFIKAVVGMAHALNLSVVAEGIETDEMSDLLTTADCDEGQGYLFARPMPLAELEVWLARRFSGHAADSCLIPSSTCQVAPK